MTISERVAYIKGLVDVLELDCNDKNSKVLKEVVLVLEDMALSIEDNEDVTNAIGEQLDEVDSDLSSLEDYVYDDEDDYEDDDVYEVECPNCHDIVYLDEEMLEDGEIACPNCGTNLEFDLSCGCDCDSCDADCSDEK